MEKQAWIPDVFLAFVMAFKAQHAWASLHYSWKKNKKTFKLENLERASDPGKICDTLILKTEAWSYRVWRRHGTRQVSIQRHGTVDVK